MWMWLDHWSSRYVKQVLEAGILRHDFKLDAEDARTQQEGARMACERLWRPEDGGFYEDSNRRGSDALYALVDELLHMSLSHQHLCRAPSTLSPLSSCRVLHCRPRRLACGLNTSPIARTEPQPARAQPRVVFSGIQPPGIPHVLYVFMLIAWHSNVNARTASESARRPPDLGEAPAHQLIYSILGWHALTLPQDPKALGAARRDMLAVLLAIGLDPERSVIFHQDEVCPRNT